MGCRFELDPIFPAFLLPFFLYSFFILWGKGEWKISHERTELVTYMGRSYCELCCCVVLLLPSLNFTEITHSTIGVAFKRRSLRLCIWFMFICFLLHLTLWYQRLDIAAQLSCSLLYLCLISLSRYNCSALLLLPGIALSHQPVLILLLYSPSPFWHLILSYQHVQILLLSSPALS